MMLPIKGFSIDDGSQHLEVEGGLRVMEKTLECRAVGSEGDYRYLGEVE